MFLGFLVGSLFRKCIPGILSDYIFKLNENKKDFEQQKTEKYYDIVCNICSDLLVGVIHCILIKKEKKNKIFIEKEEKNDLQNKKKFQFIFNDETQKKKLFYQLFTLLSLIDFFCQLCFYFSCHANRNIIEDENKILHKIDYLYSFLVIDIVARYVFSRLLLDTYFYYHHYVSIFINIIILLILFLVELFFKLDEYSIYCLILSFIQYVFYSLEDIINKLVLIKLFIFPEYLLFYKGLFTFLFFLLFTTFLVLFKDLKFYNEFNLKFLIFHITIRIIYIFFNIIRSIFLVKVIDNFSSQHISFLKVLETISLFFYYYFDSVYKKKHLIQSDYFNNDKYSDEIDLIEMISCLILLLSSLIHNEIIILNCNKLKRNTKYFMSIEANLENLGLLSKNTDIINIS